ncbi:MAG: hypothetical protein IT337_06605 [Thermomicrobiales bacterium]|nr:hypothetical protein [Thermomicrobiales bacterium]
MKQQIGLPGSTGQRALAAIGVAFVGGYLLGRASGRTRHDQPGPGFTYQADWNQAHSRSGERSRAGLAAVARATDPS